MPWYNSYQELITDIARETGEEGSELDSIILNLCQSVVSFLNTIRGTFREARGTISLVAQDYDYDLPNDFSETIDRRTSLFYANGTRRILVPIASSRIEFLEGWDPSFLGDPSLAHIFGNTLYLRPTPSVARTLFIDYYKILPKPTLTGQVVIPDKYIMALRGLIADRLEHYRESPERGALFRSLAGEVINVIKRDYAQDILPTVIVEEGL
jgi:hypothetical protein